jgi:hypothetical protein
MWSKPAPVRLTGIDDRGERAMGFTVTGIEAVEILDSRSRPALAVTVTLGDGDGVPGRGALRGVHGFQRGGRAP